MDDNENYLEYSKMNFSQFSSPFGGALAANQFAAAKFPPNLATANGQVLGLVSGADGGMQFLRPMDGSAMAAATAFQQQQQAAAAAAAAVNMQQATPAYITLPITMPGAKPGDAQQTVQIQVLNPNPMPQPAQQAPKFQMGQMQIPIQGFQQGTTVLTVAYGPQDEEMMHNHGLPEGMTIVAALQPQDLQLLAQAQNASLLQQQQQQQQQHHQQQQQIQNNDPPIHPNIKIENDQPPPIRQIKQEAVWNSIPNLTAAPAFGADIAEFLQQRGQSLNLQPFLKINNNNNNETNVPLAHGDHLIGGSIPNTPGTTTFIKREIIEENSNDNTQFGADSSQADSSFKDTSSISGDTTSSTLQEATSTHTTAAATSTTAPGENGTPITTAKARKKRKYKSKPPKPKRQKPGQVHITTALDGTVLFCCPECHMAYPEKECLEQHLAVHKIERRFICDICGAGLKRKEHLERHKLGHNPERPYICSVCLKGFKRKEHLNLHFVIHSGVKTEICGDCGKGFYRKDHLRKHIKSHMTKRLKEEMSGSGNSSAGRTNSSNGNNSNPDTTSSAATPVSLALPAGIPPGLTITTSTNSMQNLNPPQPSPLTQGICLPQGVTIHVPTSDNQTLPVQISLPQLVAQQQTASDGTTSTVLVPASEALQQQQHHSDGNQQQQQQ
ncbi:zinc finger protein 853-like [Sabethes cyaneus]|uniref:zinc finger protein 853-like n=1 Tax=Sabethes cyaneus TaxID=53552 RepID=UPI00237E1C54|nr:zinc finger protein 853-like [Sabethes cyaneus]